MPSSTLTRRNLLGLGLAGGASLMLAACTSPGAPAAGGAATLRVGWYGGDPVHAAMAKILDRYHATHKKVTIKSQHAPFADYWNKMATETAARTAPDTMRMSVSYLREYADRGALLDLGKYVGKQIDVSGLEEGVRNGGVIGKATYGIGQSSIANAGFINPEAVAAANGAMPPENWTWDELADWAKGVRSDSGGKVYGTSDLGGRFEFFGGPYTKQLGTDPFSDDGTKILFTETMLEKWWKFWADVRKDGGAPPADVTAGVTGFDSWTIVSGQTVLDFGWVQQVTFLQPLIKQKLDIVIPPHIKGGKPGYYVGNADMWSVASTSKSPEADAELINYLINDDYSVKTLGVLLGIPPSEAAIKLLDFSADSPEGKAVKYVNSLGSQKSSAPAPWPKAYNQMNTVFTKTAQDVAFGRTSPSAAAASFYKQAQTLMAQS